MTHHAAAHDGAHAHHHHADRITAYVNKRKDAVLTLLACLLLAFVVAITILTYPTWVADPIKESFVLVYMVFVTFFAGAAIILGVLRLFAARPLLVVTHEGIWISALLLGPGMVAWADIRALRLVRYPRQGVVNIVLRDQASLWRGENLGATLVLVALRGLTLSSAVVVNDALLTTSAVALIAQIREHYRQQLNQYDIAVS